MIKLNDDIDPDEDINVSEIFSMNLKILCFQYESLFFGDSDNQVETSIQFFDERGRYFFSFTDSVCHIPGAVHNLTPEERGRVDLDFTVFAPILQAVYCLKDWRGYGLQKELFQSLKEVSDETGECFVAISDPYVIVDSCYENNIKEACFRFLSNGYVRPTYWKEAVIRQCDKFLEYGLENFPLPDAVFTKPFQHFIYIPDSAPDGTKLAIKSLQKDKSIFTRDDVDTMPINVKH